MKYLLTTLFIFFAGNKLHAQQGKEHNFFALKNVNIVSMTSENNVIEHATVVIKDNTILSINKSIPDSAIIIEGEGKWLIPGLIDMHVHGLADIDFGLKYPTKGATIFVNDQDVMTPYVANGVTTIFELNGRLNTLDSETRLQKVC